MAFTIDIEKAYQEAFGVKRPIYVPVTSPVFGSPNFQGSQQVTTQPIEFQNIQPLQTDSSSIKSSLGTIVLSPITFEGGSYKERLDDGTIINTSYDTFMLPPTSTVEVTFNKSIVKTPRRGGKGEFKELIGFLDASVKIRGILIGDQEKRPEDGIRKLKALDNVPAELVVVCDYLTWLGIDYLVIESLTFPNIQGRPNMQPFELSCIEDRPVQLINNG